MSLNLRSNLRHAQPKSLILVLQKSTSTLLVRCLQFLDMLFVRRLHFLLAPLHLLIAFLHLLSTLEHLLLLLSDALHGLSHSHLGIFAGLEHLDACELLSFVGSYVRGESSLATWKKLATRSADTIKCMLFNVL